MLAACALHANEGVGAVPMILLRLRREQRGMHTTSRSQRRQWWNVMTASCPHHRQKQPSEATLRYIDELQKSSN